MTTAGEAVYLEGGGGGYLVVDLVRSQRRRGDRATKRSLEVEGTLGAAPSSRFRERPHVAALQGALCSSGGAAGPAS